MYFKKCFLLHLEVYRELPHRFECSAKHKALKTEIKGTHTHTVSLGKRQIRNKNKMRNCVCVCASFKVYIEVQSTEFSDQLREELSNDEMLFI